MKRRDFFGMAAGAVATSSLASPAISQTSPAIRWRMTSSFPKSLDISFGTGELLARHVAALTEGRFQIQAFAAGEIVGGLQALDAVSNGTVEMAHTGSVFFTGKDPAFAFGTTVPFMINPRQQHAWLYYGGGNELLNELFRKYNVYGVPLGNTGNQMGGWFRKEINKADDLRGLKFRVAGLAGNVMAKVGVVPQQIAPGDIYPALERGTIDGVEYVGPYDDEKLGFYKVAPYYYYPGWGEGGAILHAYINLDKWNELPKPYQTALEIAAQACTHSMLAQYDAKNADALHRLIANGTQLRSFSPEIIDVLYKAAQDLYGEIGASNPLFKRLLDSQTAFRERNYSFHQIADFSFDAMMLRLRRSR